MNGDQLVIGIDFEPGSVRSVMIDSINSDEITSGLLIPHCGNGFGPDYFIY